MIDPFDDGFRARLRGEPFDMNPHPLPSDAWRQWADGWNDQNEHLRDRDEALASIGWFG
jgi:hypothetical protein